MKPGLPLWLGLAGAVMALDQVSKAWVVGAFRLYESLALAPFFNVTFVFNPGAAFSFLRDAGGWQKWLFVALAFGISGWLVATIRKHSAERLLPTALSLILGGALGNVVDRLRYDAVVDFLDFHWAGVHFPAFNIADSAITVGVALMLWQQLMQKETS